MTGVPLQLSSNFPPTLTPDLHRKIVNEQNVNREF